MDASIIWSIHINDEEPLRSNVMTVVNKQEI